MNYTRSQYLNDECSHQEYYSQFVNDRVLNVVRGRIGESRIKNSKDEYSFNDILLAEWDRLDMQDVIDTKLFKAMNNSTYAEHERDKFYWSKSDNVCIAKAAAHIIREESNVVS